MYHKHLERQIKKYLEGSDIKDERIQQLLLAVSNSYTSFERDKELSEHAFSINEQEYQSVNTKLKLLTEDLENKVKTRTNELEDLAQFPMENPNPIFRVDFDGKILFLNPAAKEIKNVEYEGIKYTIRQFFASNIKYARDSGSFDVNVNSKQYIFFYKNIIGKKYINFYGADVTEKNTLRVKAQENFNRLRNFLESTEDAYYIVYDKYKEKNFITSRWKDLFGFNQLTAKNLFAEKSKCIISETIQTHTSRIKNLKIGDQVSIRYQIKNKTTGELFWLSEVINKQYDLVLDDVVVSGRITDVTKEQQFAMQIQESEARFRNLIDAVPVMVWVSDEQSKVIYSNQASKKFLGFEVEKIKNPRDYIQKIHPDDRKKVMANWNKNINKKHSFHTEYRVKDSKNNYHNILENGVPRFYADGKFAGYIGAFFDLTSEKSFQQKLLLENQKLDLLTKNSPDIILLTDKNGLIEYVSPTAKRILGYTEKEILNKPINKFICVECNNQLEKFGWLKNINQTKERKFEFRMMKKNGDLLWIESLLSPVKNGNDLKILMHNRDIHSIKAAEIVLKENEQKYRGLFENMELGVMEVDLDEKIMWVNESFENMTGYSLKYLKGKNAMKLFLPDEGATKIMYSVSNSRKQRKDSIYEVKMKKAKGELMDVVISGSPIIDLNGNVKGSVGIHWNITEVRKTERLLEEEKLSRQKDIMKATLSAEEQQREILGNELHDGVGHILTYTSLFLQMAGNSDKMSPELFGKAQEKVEQALNEVRRISRSLVPPALIDLGLKEAIIELFNQYADIKGMSFDIVTKNHDLTGIDLNAQRNIYRVIQELLNNTIKHSGASEVKLVFKRTTQKLTIYFYNNGRVFNPDKVKKGIGLKSIMNRAYFYNGLVNIQSTKANGTNFTIELPLKNIITNE
jgi:PAS domain S-box-containing protein